MINMAENNLFDEEYLEIAKRRKKQFMGPALVVIALAVVLAYTMPAVYRSTATLLIEKEEVPAKLLESTVSGYAMEQIQANKQQVMTFENLRAIAEDFDLYPDALQAGKDAEVVGLVRKNISTSVVREGVVDQRTGREKELAIAFEVSFDSDSPEIAQAVASRLAQLFMEENKRTRTGKAREATTFFAEEAEKLSVEISSLEAEIADFKRVNAAFLPETSGLNEEFVLRAKREQKTTMDAIRGMEAKQIVLQQQLQAVKTDGRLNAMRAKLAEAKQRYSDIHPDVVALKAAVKSLEDGNLNTTTLAADELGAGSLEKYQWLESELAVVRSNLQSERTTLNSINKDVEKYEQRLKQFPAVERQYLSLTRDYNNALKKYGEIKDKQMQSSLSVELEKSEKGKHLSLLEEPGMPLSPIKPNRLGIILLGFMAGIVIGVIYATLTELRDKTIYGINQLSDLLNVRPIGVIPVLER